ncbi:MAG: hypothetical protein C0594_17890 [Marinilabiliales bacterium]|nr:MAG: hypothetical protein C0594_17890 [Marinilabiliales bacterium]
MIYKIVNVLMIIMLFVAFGSVASNQDSVLTVDEFVQKSYGDSLLEKYLKNSESSERLGDYQNALYYFDKYMVRKDSIYKSNAEQKLEEKYKIFEIEKKDGEINLLNVQSLLNEEKIDKQRTSIRLILSLALVFLVMIAIVFVFYMQKEIAYKKLVKLNMEAVRIERKNDLILKKSIQKRSIPSKLSEETEQKILNDLVVLMEEEKFYLQSGFTLDEMAVKLETNRQYLSKIINDHFKKNFNAFVNEFRIKEARRLLSDFKTSGYTIEAISNMVGFGSRTSFIAAFKKYTGVTPSYFVKNQKY